MSNEDTPDDDTNEAPSDPFEERLAELERRGELVPPTGPMKPLRAVIHAPGALERFLADRDMD